MPINPHTDEVAAQAWADQFSAEVKDKARGILEEALHRQGHCTDGTDEMSLILLECALEAGAVAMGLALEQNDRLKDVEQ